MAVAAVPAASFVAAALGALAGGLAAWPSTVLFLALVHFGAALIEIARVWLSPGREGRKVDFQVQVEAAGLIVAGLILPPLAVAALLTRLWVLRRGYDASRWLQP